MGNETRVERWLDRLIARAQSPRTAAIVIASVTSSMTVAAGVAMTFVDEKSFPSVSSGLWWAVQTVTTVGYGDHVPADAAGKVLAAVVMLLGIGFVTVITAAITSAFVAREDDSGGPDGPTAEQLRRIDERLERIEAALQKTHTGG